MKKLTALALAVIIAAMLLTACSGGGGESSSAVSAPGDGQGGIADISDTVSRHHGGSPSDISSTPEPDPDPGPEPEPEPEPDPEPDPEPVKPDTLEGLDIANLNLGSPASRWRIAITKESALNAVKVVASYYDPVNAVYDGSVTRFFTNDMQFLKAVPGDYTYVCTCNGFFDKTLEHGYVVDNRKDYILITEAPPHGHGAMSGGYYYCTKYGVPIRRSISEGPTELERIPDGVLVPCVEYSGDILEEFSAELAGKKYGLSGNEGIVVPFEYDNITISHWGVCVYRAEKDGRVYYFDTKGKLLTPEGFSCGGDVYENRALVFEGSQGYIIEFS